MLHRTLSPAAMHVTNDNQSAARKERITAKHNSAKETKMIILLPSMLEAVKRIKSPSIERDFKAFDIYMHGTHIFA